MSQTVTVQHLVGGIVTEDTHTGDRIVTHMRDSGNTLLSVYRDGRLTEDVIYRQCDRIHRRFHAEGDA